MAKSHSLAWCDDLSRGFGGVAGLVIWFRLALSAGFVYGYGVATRLGRSGVWQT